MAIVYCGESNRQAYYIKEADINIYSLQELAFFIYKNPMLISNSFINKSLCIYIKKYLNNNELYNDLNEIYSSHEHNVLKGIVTILRYSDMYNSKEIDKFIEFINYLTKLDENSYIKICADNLFKLKKYYKAIKQYEKILDDVESLRCIGYAYAKLLVFDRAIEYLSLAFDKNKDLSILKDLYICHKLNKSTVEFIKYKSYINDETLTDWEYEIVRLQIDTKNSTKINELNDIFLMGENYIKDNVNLILNELKEKYRFVG